MYLVRLEHQASFWHSIVVLNGCPLHQAKGHRTLGSARSHAVGAAVLAPEQEISAAPKISPAIGEVCTTQMMFVSRSLLETFCHCKRRGFLDGIFLVEGALIGAS